MSGNRKRIFVFPAGIGDGLMATAVAKAYFQHFHMKMAVAHAREDLFLGNPYIEHHPEYSVQSMLDNWKGCLKKANSDGVELIAVSYLDFETEGGFCVNYKLTSRNFIGRLCSRVGLTGDVSCCPEIYLTSEERDFGRHYGLGKIVIVAQGLQKIKTWNTIKAQQVVDSFPEYSFVQLGTSDDIPLQNVENLCGKISLRQSASVLLYAKCFIGPIGALMHLARAVGCPSIVLASSCEQDCSTTYYPEYTYLLPRLPCNLCREGDMNFVICNFPERCLDISVNQVCETLNEFLLSKSSRNLSVHVEHVVAQPANGLDDLDNQYRKFRYGTAIIQEMQNMSCVSSKTWHFLHSSKWKPLCKLKYNSTSDIVINLKKSWIPTAWYAITALESHYTADDFLKHGKQVRLTNSWTYFTPSDYYNFLHKDFGRIISSDIPSSMRQTGNGVCIWIKTIQLKMLLCSINRRWRRWQMFIFVLLLNLRWRIHSVCSNIVNMAHLGL